VNRQLRRAVQSVLRNERCGSCGGELDAEAHEAELRGPSGQVIPHFICRRCVGEMLSGPDGRREVAKRARLTLAPPEGSA
jgi:hypothetical protein